MKITENIILTKHHYAPAGASIDRYLISDKPLDVLIKALEKYTITIDLKSSEKKVVYISTREKSGGEEKEVVVPLDAKFSNGARDVVYYLKERNGLELEVSNYSSVTERPGKGVCGGTFAGDFGIIGRLTLEGREVDMGLIQKVKLAMEETYLDKEEVTNDFDLPKPRNL